MDFFVLDVDVVFVQASKDEIYKLRGNSLSLADVSFRYQEFTSLKEGGGASSRTAQRCYVGRLWGRDVQGRSVCVAVVDTVSTSYRQLSEKVTPRATALAASLQERFDRQQGTGVVRVRAVDRFTTNGWRSGAEDPDVCEALGWLQFVCSSPDVKFRLADVTGKVQDEMNLKLATPITAEAKVPVAVELLQAIGASPGAWCRVDAEAAHCARFGTALFAQATRASFGPCLRPELSGALSAIRVLSFDIECYSASKGFPDGTLEEDPCICIGLCARTLYGDGGPPVDRVLCLGSAESDSVELRCFETEGRLLMAFAEELRALDVDVIVGYNQSTFDWAYLNKRLELLRRNGGLNPEEARCCQQLSRALQAVCPTTQLSLSSSAMGENPTCKPRILGCFEVDLWFYLKRENYNVDALPDLKLNTVARHFLQVGKHDLPAKDIFACYEQGPRERGRVAEYCLQDTRLVLDLVERLEVLPRVLLMARVTGVVPHDVLFRGQQIQVYAQLRRMAHGLQYVIEDAVGESDKEAFVGAHVLAPKSGFYLDPIVTVDFASLYPSIMRTYNLCPSTHWVPRGGAEEARPKCIELPHVHHLFVRSDVHRGLLPRILDGLLQQRKQAKRDMAAAGDPLRRSLLNSLQLALKISANSVYGFTGASRGLMQCKQVAESTTGAGRHIIEFTQNALLRLYDGVDVVYGDTDSCFVRLPEAMRGASLDEVFKFGERMASDVTRAFAETLEVTSHVCLEMEKVLQPIILYDQKKRYAGWCIEDPAKPGKMLARGIELVRKDSISVTRDCQRDILRCLLEERDPRQAVDVARRAVERVLALREGDDFGFIKQSKSLRSNYQKEESLPHVVVNNLMRERAPGSESRVGDRVEYVVIASETPRIVDKVECCAYALEHRLPPDWVHYVDAMEKPLTRLLCVPLRHTQPELAQELESFFAAARETAAKQVAAVSLARHGTRWISGHRCKKGTGTQLKLDLPGVHACSAAPKRARKGPAPPPSSVDIRLFLKKAPEP